MSDKELRQEKAPALRARLRALWWVLSGQRCLVVRWCGAGDVDAVAFRMNTFALEDIEEFVGDAAEEYGWDDEQRWLMGGAAPWETSASRSR